MSNDPRDVLIKALPEFDFDFYRNARENLFLRVFSTLYSEHTQSRASPLDAAEVQRLSEAAVEHSKIAALELTMATRKEDLFRDGVSSRNGTGDGEMAELEDKA